MPKLLFVCVWRNGYTSLCFVAVRLRIFMYAPFLGGIAAERSVSYDKSAYLCNRFYLKERMLTFLVL